MALQSFTPWVLLAPPLLDAGYGQTTLDALGEYGAFIIRAPKTGTIDRVHFRAGSVTSNGDGLRIRVETVSATDGNPSGTLVGGSSEVTHTTTTANAFNRTPAGLGASVTKGDLIAIKLASPGTGATVNLQITPTNGGGVWPHGHSGFFMSQNYYVEAVPTPSRVGSVRIMLFAVEYNDGTCPYIVNAAPIETGSAPGTNTGSTPDERAALITMPFSARCVALAANLDADGDFDMILYDSASNVLASVSCDADIDAGGTGYAHWAPPFQTPVNVIAGQQYRLAIKPTTSTSLQIQQLQLNTSTGGTRIREAVNGTDQKFKLSTRTDGGSWTETDDTFLCVGMWLDSLR